MMTPLALGVPLTVVTVLGLLLNGYILLVVLLTKQVKFHYGDVNVVRLLF